MSAMLVGSQSTGVAGSRPKQLRRIEHTTGSQGALHVYRLSARIVDRK